MFDDTHDRLFFGRGCERQLSGVGTVKRKNFQLGNCAHYSLHGYFRLLFCTRNVRLRTILQLIVEYFSNSIDGGFDTNVLDQLKIGTTKSRILKCICRWRKIEKKIRCCFFSLHYPVGNANLLIVKTAKK